MSHKLNIDFDIDNYNIEEIIAITNMKYLPLNRGKIIEQISKLKDKFSQYPKYLIFFEKAREKLLNHLKDMNEETWKEAYEHDDSIASQVLTNQFVSEKKESNKSLLLDSTRDVIARKRIPMDQNYMLKSTTQGTKNPVAINTIKRIVNLDSHYRQILDPSSCQCIEQSEICGTTANKEERLYTSTNYTVNLNQSLTNVLDLTLESVEIPNSWYTFSSDYGTNSIRFTSKNGGSDWTELVIDISAGNYTGQQMEDALNGKLDMAPRKITHDGSPPDIDIGIDFSFNSIDGKFLIHNRSAFNRVAHFYADPKIFGNVSSDNCTSGKVGAGGKVDYNLGWLLGFRVRKQDFNNKEGIYSLAPFDNHGPKYFIISLDDFNNNKPNKDLISLVDNQSSSFKLPKYFNSQTMDIRYSTTIEEDERSPPVIKYYPGHEGDEGYKCIDVSNKLNNDRRCSENALNIDLRSNLTKNQQYTVEQIQLARSSKSVDRYYSPNSTDLLARIPISRTPGDYSQVIIHKNDQPEHSKRIYFGPIKLSKCTVRLLDDKGYEVNLNDRDWSLAISVTQLYQY